jgi:hypothetical protein
MPAYVSKTTVRSALRLRTKDLDEGIRSAGILPNSRTSQGRPSYWFDQAAMDKLLLALKRKGKIAEDLDFDVGNDPKARPKIPSPVEHSPGPAPSPASDEESSPAPSPGPAPAPTTSQAPRGTAAAMREYGTPSSVVAFRYYRVRRGRGYVYEGEHADPLSRDEIEDLYGPGTYKIEEWNGAEMKNCWKGFQVGEEEEIEDDESPDDVEDDDDPPGQAGLFPGAQAPAGGDQAALLDSYRKIQDMTAKLVGDGGKSNSMIGDVLVLMTKQIDAAEKAADRREKEADAKHKRDLERMDKEYENRLAREREFLATLDKNAKELQKALQDVGNRERDSNVQLLDSIRSTIAEQRQAIADERDSMREERRRMLDDVEDLTRRIKDAGAGQGPIVGLVSQGLQEARTVAQQIMAMKGYGSLPAMPGMQMLPGPQGDAAAAAGAGQGGQPEPEAPAGGGGLFDLMARNRMVQDFLVLASMGIQSESDPSDLAESIVVQSYQDRTGQASVVLNFLSTATPQMVVSKLKPPVEVRDAMLSSAGAAYWRAFQERIRFVLANIRGAGPAAGQGPNPQSEEPEPEEDEDEIEPADVVTGDQAPKPDNAPGGLHEGNPPPEVSGARIIS